MSEILNKRQRRIADKLFYGIIGLLVLVLGGLGSVIIHNRIATVSRRIDKRTASTANYLERVLPGAVFHLDAKRIHQDIEKAASDELQAVEIFDSDGERIYVYERASEDLVYDKKIEKELDYGGNKIGKMAAYFSSAPLMKSLRIEELLRLVILISAAGLVLAAGLYFFVKRMIIHPIEGILAFSESVSKGNYNKRIDIASNDEMGMLQKSLNKMADALEESVEGLKSSFFEAEGAYQQALEASRLKSEFLASMSHEIRTPLNAIMGFSDILLEDEKDEERRLGLKTIKNSANILLENINDILDFSKLEAGKLKLTEVEYSLLDLIEEITPIIHLRLHGKKVVFTANVADELKRPLSGDRTRLRQVMLNILINATKFTDSGQIELKASRTSDGYTTLFTINDTGVGIPKEYHERIFEPFTQVDGTFARQQGGVGLGLAIAKRLVQMMDGKIWLDSEPQKGTTFYFTVPVRDATF